MSIQRHSCTHIMTVCGHCCCGRNGRVCDVCVDKIDHEIFLTVNTCAARTDETAHPTASVANNNIRFGFSTVYCRGIFTDDDDDDEKQFFQILLKTP